MSRLRKIIISSLESNHKNFFIVDACFLANKYIPLKIVPNNQKQRVQSCVEWWKIIEEQINKKRAIVYIPDICVAEVIKVFSKMYYQEALFSCYQKYNACVKKFRNDIRTTHKELASKTRHIKYHDVPTSRDILISVERFNRVFNLKGFSVSVPDLILVATAKYLMDFYNVPKKYIHILTMDKSLKKGSNKIAEIPSAYDPSSQKASSFFK